MAMADPKDNELMYIEAIKSYTKKLNEGKMVAPKIYGYIWQFLSPESIDEVKNQADYVKFNEEKEKAIQDKFLKSKAVQEEQKK